MSLPLCHLRTITEMGNVPGDWKKGNITPTFNKGNASPASLTPCPEIHEANPSGNHNLPNQIILVFTTQRVSDTELFNNCYFMLSLLLFCTSDPAASVSSPLEWCLFVPYLQLQQAQVYIYEIEIYFPPEFGHSEVLGSFWALCSQWCQGPPIIGSDTGNEECGGGRAWSQHVPICLLIGDKLEFGNSFNHSC